MSKRSVPFVLTSNAINNFIKRVKQKHGPRRSTPSSRSLLGGDQSDSLGHLHLDDRSSQHRILKKQQRGTRCATNGGPISKVCLHQVCPGRRSCCALPQPCCSCCSMPQPRRIPPAASAAALPQPCRSVCRASTTGLPQRMPQLCRA